VFHNQFIYKIDRLTNKVSSSYQAGRKWIPIEEQISFEEFADREMKGMSSGKRNPLDEVIIPPDYVGKNQSLLHD
jgi:hypothetical protein